MKLAIFGTSGFAREARDIAVSVGYDEILFVGRTPENPVQGFPVVTEDDVPLLARENFAFVIGIGAPVTRKTVWGRFPTLHYVNLIHPAATFGFGQREELQRKSGNIVFAGARLTNQIQVGNFGIYYLNCTVAHDCIVEDFVTICPGANLSGNVWLKEGAFLGANSCVIQGKSTAEKIVVGRYAVVGAGAAVTKNIPDNTMVKGVPAH